MTLSSSALLTASESRTADEAAIATGISGEQLMENAGKAVAAFIMQEYAIVPVVVVCGPGNNGGDGFVIARLLREENWPVVLAVTSEAKNARGIGNADQGMISVFTPELLKNGGLIVDAIFGTGLDREVIGSFCDAINAINASGLPVISVDIASGIHADTGAVMGTAVRATKTVSFIRPKPGHVLLPGKVHTGELSVYDIGISAETITPTHFLNTPALWRMHFPLPSPESHKYSRGSTLVVGGGISSSGAARLSAIAALRAGSGLVTIAVSAQALGVYAASLLAVMVKTVENLAQLASVLEDKRITTALIGPGCEIGEQTREQTLLLLAQKISCVIDAGAITAFSHTPRTLFKAIQHPAVLTPHEGEFSRLFKVTGSKAQRASQAAKIAGAVVVLKGNDTVIAAPDGRVAINANAPVWLATAGSGDVLAGIIAGLLAQGMPVYEAACSGVWIHAEAANHVGPGLIAEDLPAAMPFAVRQLWN